MKNLTTVAILLAALSGYAQQSTGPVYRQFLSNPYLSNPAFVAINDQSEINLVYRKQWINFKDAPETSGFSVQYPTNSRVVLGMSFFSDKQVMLRNTSFLGTFGYVVPITDQETIRFGISAGIGSNRLDLTTEELNSGDPAIVNAAQNNHYVDGNFGMVYTNKGLRLGFSLTRLFQSDPFSQETFNQFKLANLKNRLYSVSYRFPVGITQDFSLEPYFLYRQSADGLQNYWEAASMVYFKENLWTGVSYNQRNGVGLFFGLNVMDKFNFSYSYEFPPMNTDFTASSSHELHMGFQFGTKKSRPVVSRNASYKKTVAKNKKAIHRDMKEDQRMAEKAAQLQKTVVYEEVAAPDGVPDVGTEASAPISVQEAFRDGAPPKSLVLEPGYYVVVGAFSQPKYAYRFSRTIIAKGYSATVALNPGKNLYYVYIFSSYDPEESKKERSQFKARNLLHDAWIYKME